MKKLIVIALFFIGSFFSTQANAAGILGCVLDVDCGPNGCSVIFLDCSTGGGTEVHYQCNQAPPEDGSGCDCLNPSVLTPKNFQCLQIVAEENLEPNHP